MPEFKAVKISIDSLHTEMQSLRTEMKPRDDRMEQIVQSGDGKNETAIRALSENWTTPSTSASASPASKRGFRASSPAGPAALDLRK